METSTIQKWDVPFAASRGPSVAIVSEDGGTTILLVIAPQGVDSYPKYLLRYENVIAHLCYEEAFAPDRDYPKSDENVMSCAFKWINSPWLTAYRRGSDFLRGCQGVELQHFVIYGGDSIVEVVAPGEPAITKIEQRQIISTQYEV